MADWDWTANWPVLREYENDHLACVAMPLGGIGTGTVAVGGRGELRDWELCNRPSKGFSPRHACFVLRCQPAGGPPLARCLERALLPPYEGSSGARQPNHGLPRFRHGRFLAAYPLAQVELTDPDVPLAVRLEAFCPMAPGDAAASGWPVAVLRYVLHNPTSNDVEATVCGSLENFIGRDGSGGECRDNHAAYREAPGVRGLGLTSLGADPDDERTGSLALAVLGEGGTVSYRTAWAQLSWGDTLLDFWDDLLEDGDLTDRDRGDQAAPTASLAWRATAPAGGTIAVTFALTWHFPNRQTWTPADDGLSNTIGNAYTTRWPDAWAVAAEAVDALPELEARTVAFVRDFCASDLPPVVKEAALFNLSTLRSTTCFQTPDGKLYGWEGCHDTHGCCLGSCTHVWNYEQATGYLYGELARGMREIEFLHATDQRGLMSFRVHLPLGRATRQSQAAADGQMGCLLKLYREWRLAGDDDWLARLWPAARRALAFCWEPGGWDADRDGVMEGCQHNTMDVEYYGPNPQMAGWYLAALRAGAAMAEAVGDDAFAADCARLADQGREWIDAHLFNGEYYEHLVRPPGDAPIADGLRLHMGAQDLTEPELQLGAGCLVDQLVGQQFAQLVGLGHLLDPAQVRATLQAVLRYNFRENLFGHFNHLRSYALADEAALLMASYPRGRRPRRPFPYFNEVMTGFEYSTAVHLLQEGFIDDGLRVIAAIRARYDGRRRNPFDEAECGHHYARAMASWGAVVALSGFAYDGRAGRLTFAAPPEPRRWFWSSGDAWGTVRIEPTSAGWTVDLAVREGRLKLASLALTGGGEVAVEPERQLAGPAEVNLVVTRG